VKIRREALCRQQVAAGNNCVAVGIAELPLESGSGSSGGGSGGGSIPCGPPCLDYLKVQGTCCESVIGYLTVPVGAVGPLLLDGTTYTVPFATTEGALVASTTRGCKAICMSPGGATSAVLNDGMTRSPVVRVPSLACAARLKAFVESPDTFTLVKAAFDSTSRFARLKECKAAVAGRDVHLRFRALTGDAMGMNMISKGTEAALNAIIEYSDEAGGGSRPFAAMRPVALSGNMCTDKKASSMNWIEGRGKAVCVEVIIPSAVVRSVLKTTVAALVEVNTRKNLIGV
jgi:hydroxymethylglutaryl-CoA reductase (NADPH)